MAKKSVAGFALTAAIAIGYAAIAVDFKGYITSIECMLGWSDV